MDFFPSTIIKRSGSKIPSTAKEFGRLSLKTTKEKVQSNNQIEPLQEEHSHNYKILKKIMPQSEILGWIQRTTIYLQEVEPNVVITH